MSSLLQIWKVAVPATGWVPIYCPIAGSCLKAWFNYDGDLHLRSNPEDAKTDYLCALADGNQFQVPFVTPVVMDGCRPIAYAQAASGTVNVTLFCVMQ